MIKCLKMNIQEKFELANWGIDFAKKNGANDAFVAVYDQKRSDITVRNQKIEKIQESIRNGFGIKLYVDNKFSETSASILKKDTLEKFIKESIANTKYLAEDKFRVLPDPDMYYKGGGVDLKNYDSSYNTIDTESKLNLTKQIENETIGMDDRIIAVTVSYYDNLNCRVIVSSNGLQAYQEVSSFTASASASIKDKNSRPRDFDSARSCFFDKLDVAGIGQNAVKRALRKLGQEKINSGKYTMLLENRIATNLLSSFLRATYGNNLQQKNSFLESMKNKKVASDKLTITDNPFIISGLGSQLFDNDGIKAEVMSVIDKGFLENYYIENYYGRKLGMKPTKMYPSNLEFAYGNKNLDELIKSINKGIMVTDFNGGNTNTATGDFSYGIDGFLIEKGKIVKPVTEMIISGNHKILWNKLVEVGNDISENASWKTASMLFEDIDFSGL